MDIEQIKEKAKSDPRRIVFPEGDDDRILQAASIVQREGIALPILIGNAEDIQQRAQSADIDLEGVKIINHLHDERMDAYVQEFFELRRHKGISEEEATSMLADPIYFGTMMVHKGDADGLISGARHSTADTIRPALQIIKTAPGHSLASSFFVMLCEGKAYLFADCGFVINPDAEQLSEIAISTAESAKKLGMEPRIAMLSFSTKGSAKDPLVDKVVQATALVKEKRPELIIDGELQLDAALVPAVASKKCPDASIKGDANVLIFPDLNAGNIGYKLVQRLAHAIAVGPILQGLNKPINDLSRGCSIEDIVDVTAITVVEAQR
jgi:phosphate acetyltransferase